MKTITRKLTALLLAIMLINVNNVFAFDGEGNTRQTQPIYTPGQYMELFESKGIEIPKGALFGVSTAQEADGAEYEVPKMTVVEEEKVSDYLLFEYAEDDLGNIEVLPLDDVMAELEGPCDRAITSNSQNRGVYNVTITATYNKRYNSSTHYYEYQPISMSMVSSTTQDAKVNYYIYGWKTGTNTHMGHSIVRGEYPAYQGQLYSRTNMCSTYIQPIVGFHKLVVKVGNHSEVDLTLNGPNGVND